MIQRKKDYAKKNKCNKKAFTKTPSLDASNYKLIRKICEIDILGDTRIEVKA